MTTQSVSSETIFLKSQPALAQSGYWRALLSEWRRRARSRRELASLSPLDLKDLGYPARVEAEKAKPFWRA